MDHFLARAVVRRWIEPPSDEPGALDSLDLLPDEDTPGLVWRLADERGSAADIEVFDDPGLLLDLTVWEDLEALQQWLATDEAAAVQRRIEGVLTAAGVGASEVRWWVRDDEVPTVEDAEVRLARLRARGSGPLAFGPDEPHGPPS